MYASEGVLEAPTESQSVSQPLAEMPIIPVSERSGEEVIDTRFGRVTITYDDPLHLEKGMLGMPDKFYFCLLPFPVKKFAAFRLMQCLEDHALSFITLPLELDNPIVERKDLLDAALDLSITPDQLETLLVVNVYREGSTVHMSVNARAPVFINRATGKGEQLVLRNNKYLVRHMLGTEYTRADA